MSSPKQLVLDAASDGPFPLTKVELLGRLDEQVTDPGVLASVSLLDDDEFADQDELMRAIDMAFGMPDAFADESVLEHETTRRHRA
jgi:hypothetical protein